MTDASGSGRRRRPRVAGPSQQELDALPVEKRLELLDRRRQSRHQWFTSAGVLLGVVLTAGSLIATAQTLRNGQEELRTAREAQITDRYTKAVEQLGSDKLDVRLGAVYALERIAVDSGRDRFTIISVLASFAREHDPASNVPPPAEPHADVYAVLVVLGRMDRPPLERLDLHGIRVPHADLRKVDSTTWTCAEPS